jgi:hypothetical protein
LKVKYNKEVCLLLGCAKVETNKGKVVEGPNALSYSGPSVLSISDSYRKRQNTAMVAPKSLLKGKWQQPMLGDYESTSTQLHLVQDGSGY